MPPALRPDFLPTAVGSLPHTDPVAACDLICRHLPEIPAWPQLPRRDFRESIYAQYSAGFPGTVLTGERLYVDCAHDLGSEMERLYTRYLESDVESQGLDASYAAGLAHFLTLTFPEAIAVKGHVIGPVSWGLTVTDQERRPILYDQALADAAAKHLRLSAAWQERALSRLAPQTIIFVDEPYLASYGSAYIAIERVQVVALLEEVFGGLHGLKGVHCCGNTDWSLLLETSADILSFDAYNFAHTLALYPEALTAFLARGGILAWGIVPVQDEAQVWAASAADLTRRLEAVIWHVADRGVPLQALLGAALVTPACGLGTLSEPAAARALELTAAVSRQMRARYVCAGVER